MRRRPSSVFLVVLPLIVLAGVLYAIPPVRERVNYRIEQVRLRIRYAIFPPENVVFQPQDQVAAIVRATVLAMTPSPTPVPTRTPTRLPFTPGPTFTPTATATPIPAQAALTGVKYVSQHGINNYCAPANLAMELSYWGWKGKREDIGNVVKPFKDDFNVMPYELADYVTGQTGLQAVLRSGGTLDLLKTLVAGGFPVLVEKGAYMVDLSGKNTWMGHYQVMTGYDDVKRRFIAQDSYYSRDYPVTYDDLMAGWRAFNFTFLVVTSPERRGELDTLLGRYADENEARQLALDIANLEQAKMTGIDQYFAWYNRGTSLVALNDFSGAAASYDEAFRLYPFLPVDKRPFRMLWYQTGPYNAYYNAGRYQDVVNLATETLNAMDKPYLEESLYWRALANVVIGKRDDAIADLRTSLKYHPDFSPSLAELTQLGVAP